MPFPGITPSSLTKPDPPRYARSVRWHRAALCCPSILATCFGPCQFPPISSDYSDWDTLHTRQAQCLYHQPPLSRPKCFQHHRCFGSARQVGLALSRYQPLATCRVSPVPTCPKALPSLCQHIVPCVSWGLHIWSKCPLSWIRTGCIVSLCDFKGLALSPFRTLTVLLSDTYLA